METRSGRAALTECQLQSKSRGVVARWVASLSEKKPQLDKESILATVRFMAKVTSKLQVTLPKSLADRYSIRPGDEIQWEAADEVIRIVPARSFSARPDIAMRLRVFDEATVRQRNRQERSEPAASQGRGWTREELYDRGSSD